MGSPLCRWTWHAPVGGRVDTQPARADHHLRFRRPPLAILDNAVYPYTIRPLCGGLTVRIDLDLGDEDDVDALDHHLGEHGLDIDDILVATELVVPRRHGDRLYAYGRGVGGRPIVIVLQRQGSAWRPRTAWPMDNVERDWWRRHGGR